MTGEKSNHRPSLGVMSWNVQGVANKLNIISVLAENNQISVIFYVSQRIGCQVQKLKVYPCRVLKLYPFL